MTDQQLLSIGIAAGAAIWPISIWASRLVDRALARFGHPCRKGHIWVHSGGRNASCSKDCHCSVPVMLCARCHDCDYGDNAEARATIEACPTAADVRACTCQGGFDQPFGAELRANDCPVHGEEKA